MDSWKKMRAVSKTKGNHQPAVEPSMALNAVCPYYTMFPLGFPISVLKRIGKPRLRVLDPFCGSGSTLLAAKILNRNYLGIELDAQYHAAANKRLHPDGIRASEGFYSPLKGQASRPQPPIGGALQSSAIN